MWNLFVDTDSLYMEIKRQYGQHARVDYIDLPLNIARTLPELDHFDEKVALVLRHGDTLQPFWNSLERWGYRVIPTDKGMQQITVGSQVNELASRCDGLVIVAAGCWLRVLAQQVLDKGNKVVLATPPHNDHTNPEIDAATMPLEYRRVVIDHRWLWKRRQEVR